MQDFPRKQQCVLCYAPLEGVLTVLLLRDDSHYYLSKDMFVLYYVLVSS